MTDSLLAFLRRQNANAFMALRGLDEEFDTMMLMELRFPWRKVTEMSSAASQVPLPRVSPFRGL